MNTPNPVLKLCADTEDQHLVYAEVYPPNLPDTDKEYMNPADIQEMAFKFMKNNKVRNIDVRHDNKVVKACVVESFIARKCDDTFIPGSWVVGIHIEDDSVWNAIKSGELNGFSMEAMVSKTPEIMELDIPPVLTGHTTKSDDGHSHDFYVSFNDKGDFLGGVTSKADDGHSHLIKRGTLTEDSNGHNHKFSYVEKIHAQNQNASH